MSLPQGELYQLILENLPVGVYMVDREGKILFWNAGVERITGYLRQDVLGHRCQDRFLQHTDAENNPMEGSSIPLLETMREGHPVVTRASLRNKGGHFLSVRLRTVPLRDERGSIQGAVEILEELASSSRLDRRQNKLAAFGCIDGLTGLLNHNRIQAQIQAQLGLYAQHPVPFCVLCFAIDGLEKLRERYGQAAVDAALRVVGQTLENGLRPTDFIGHWQENEFIAILQECIESDVTTVGQRLQKMVQHAAISWWGDMLRVTVSAGATPAHDHDSVESIVGRAEEALKKSSRAGTGQIALVSS
jgi:diguanylate cyclase (GGDEF)-like protein/PAS domain S-box-containing protein